MKNHPLKFNIFTIFPTYFDSPFSETIIKRAVKKGRVNIDIHDLRTWTTDVHKTVDDSPYGGGAGMVMKMEPFYRGLKESQISKGVKNKRVILLSPRGVRFKQSKAHELASLDEITLLCGRYEGVDQRVSDYLIDEEISLGEFVLSGGEIAALAVVDCITRLIPGVLGNSQSVQEESFSQEGLLEYPQYTKPSEFITDEGEILKVPEVLLSGDHQKIIDWRKEQQKHENNS